MAFNCFEYSFNINKIDTTINDINIDKSDIKLGNYKFCL